jgi:dTDP-4-dehydrorhamnose reductase
MKKQRYLMLGGSGKLGKALQTLISCDAPSHQEVDILRPSQLLDAIRKTTYSGVLHLAALTQATLADKQPQEAYRLNVIGTRHVAEAAKERLPVIYISTDYVFSGLIGDYREGDIPSPANWYGATKYAGELEIQESGVQHCILRTSFRPAHWGFPTAYTNVYTSADFIDVIAQEVALAIRLDLRGLWHVGTPTKTFYELAHRRNPDVKPEECRDPLFPKCRNLNIDKWLARKKEIKPL